MVDVARPRDDTLRSHSGRAARFPAIRPPAYTLSGAELGCWASHLSAWACILASGEAAGTVLEDDLVLAPDFAGCVGELERDLGDFDLVYLGTSSRNLSRRRAKAIGGLRIHAPVGLVLNTWGYVVSAAWIARLFTRPVFAITCRSITSSAVAAAPSEAPHRRRAAGLRPRGPGHGEGLADPALHLASGPAARR